MARGIPGHFSLNITRRRDTIEVEYATTQLCVASRETAIPRLAVTLTETRRTYNASSRIALSR